MKTTKSKSKKEGLPVRPMQSVVPTTAAPTAPAPACAAPEPPPAAPAPEPQAPRTLPFVNYTDRDRNRQLPTDSVLELLRRWLPSVLPSARVVGRWIWVSFTEPPPEAIRGQLSQFGFHWNNGRACWQHPCGVPATVRGPDPLKRYGSRAAA